MSGFKDMVAADNINVFLNFEEFAEKRTVIYDGVTYDGPDHNGIPIVLSGLKEKDRRQLVSDHVQGLYLVSSVLHCAIEDLGGNQPEIREFYVASSVCEIGMLRIELEAIDE